ncbi:MAG TPA: NUDIX domain-containing protein [Candidatus Saccharimonadales bacterium]|nr:NUDIX domain-containing protein [Candidatus Saccharimonadales bacterium]
MIEHETGNERQPTSRGAGIIFHIKPTDQLMFFLRDDRPDISCPGMIDIIGGHLEGDESPEEAARREVGEELKDKDTGQSFVASDIKLFKTWVDDRPGEHNVFVAELDSVPNLRTDEGQGLVFLTREQARSTNFAYGYSEVVNEYLDSLEATSENPAS